MDLGCLKWTWYILVFTCQKVDLGRVSTVSESQWKNGFLEKSQWKSVKVSESQWIALVGQWKVSEKDFWHNWFLLLLLLDISSDPSFCGFPALELKIFLNLGDNLSWKSMEILHSWAFQSSRILRNSEKNASNSSHSGTFQSSRIQNFLQPRWKYPLWY